ncbi:serine hydrolase domain-containing protein [Pararhodonellum marinum]|uniref:serine hydrolase domain-containing protein n=1 Tax=Pararhodonellum marinum TaxID=2755358 RepID=UPI00188E9C9F|nr:serine hydrolase domain-containing protein [Pararhodonellum marinum]
MRLKFVFNLFVLSVIFSCRPSQPIEYPGVTWSYAQHEEIGVDETHLSHALEFLRNESFEDGIRQVMVIRNGKVIFSGDAVERSQNIYSCSKGFTSLVMGLLVDEGKIRLDDHVAEILPELKYQYGTLTWRHFATMTSGYSAEGRSRWEDENADWSLTPYSPEAPHFEPGSHFEYWDEAQMMFGKGLTEVLGRTMHEYLDVAIMQKIGLGEWHWGTEQTTSAGIDINNGCTGVHLNASQLARIGWLFLNRGKWKEEQLVSARFVREATSPQVPSGLPVFRGDRANVKGSGSYGFNWWVNSKDGLSRMPHAPIGTAYLSGLNHNMCFIIPEWNMVIVRMGDDKNPIRPKHEVWDDFFRILSSGISS